MGFELVQAFFGKKLSEFFCLQQLFFYGLLYTRRTAPRYLYE